MASTGKLSKEIAFRSIIKWENADTRFNLNKRGFVL